MQRTEWQLPEIDVGKWEKWLNVLKRYKLQTIKQISHGDVMYSMVTVVHYTVAYFKVIID